MTDRPIIFSGPMVRALLEGRKTMTRRLAWRNYPDMKNLKWSRWFKVREGDRLYVRESFNSTWGDSIIYKADGGSAKEAGYRDEPKWKPSIYMPRWASRLTLEVTGKKIEPLRSISDEDAKLEGCESRDAFKELWISLHGEWAPIEVVALTFTVHKHNIDRPAFNKEPKADASPIAQGEAI